MSTITAIHKPAQVVAEATATVTADDETAAGLITAGLRALGETPSSLFGYGIRDETQARLDLNSPRLLTGEFTVYAYRD